MILNIDDKVRFKYDHFPAKEGQEGTVVKIDQEKNSSFCYTIRIFWIEKQKFSDIVIHETGILRYLIK